MKPAASTGGSSPAIATLSQRFAVAGASRHRRRGLTTDTAIPFSWPQCVASMCAYIWLLSNFARTDFAVKDLDASHSIDPDVYINFGPYAYTVNTFTNAGIDINSSSSTITSAETVALWSYKFDTTSLGMRAFAEFLRVSAFPPCVLYRGKCTGTELAPDTAFSMLDTLVDAIRSNASSPTASRFVPKTMTTAASTTASAAKLDAAHRDSHQLLEPQRVLLRASNDFFDRIHHYLMPQIFSTPAWRTCHALYYSAEALDVAAAARVSAATNISRQQQQHDSNRSVADFCSRAYNEVRPFFCEDHWTNFARSCHTDDSECRDVGHVSVHATRRLDALRLAHPTATIDALILEESKDLIVHRGGVSLYADRAADVVTIFRVRECHSSDDDSGAERCVTRVLDEYRYEVETFATNILAWTSIVVLLRSIAQTYYWLRLAMLCCGCYVAAKRRSGPSGRLRSASVFMTARRAFVMFAKIPSQVVGYSSLFPLACYLAAHIVDSSTVYELIAQQFDSFNGLFHMGLMELIHFGSVQMRSILLLACAAHVAARVSTQHCWSPLDGVWGMPQFSIALISSLTIISQFRFIALRWTPIRAIQYVQTASRIHPTVESLMCNNGGGGKASLGGIFQDVKTATTSTALLLLLFGVTCVAVKLVIPKIKITLVFWRAYSVTPLSAGVLWSASALAVSWNDDLFHSSHADSAIQKQKQWPSLRKLTSTVRPHVSRAAATPTSVQKHTYSPSTQSSPATAQSARQTQRREQLPTKPVHLDTLDDRSEVVESAMYLMNIAMLSDPMTFLAWRFGLASKTRLGYYRSTATQHVYLVPLQYTKRRSGLDWSGFVLERTVCAGELSWSEIITCG